MVHSKYQVSTYNGLQFPICKIKIDGLHSKTMLGLMEFRVQSSSCVPQASRAPVLTGIWEDDPVCMGQSAS
jgi:hypothetical protein